MCESLVNTQLVTHYSPQIQNAQDYFPFGMIMPGRSVQDLENNYRYGFQNQETDKELWDGAVSYKYRIEDPRLGRFFSVDPLAPKYPWYTPYQFSGNRVIDAIELEGLEPSLTTDDKSNIEGIFAYGEVPGASEMQRGDRTWTVGDFQMKSITLGDGSQAFLASRIDYAPDSKKYTNYKGSYLADNCNCDMTQEAYIITPEGYGNFVRQKDWYYNKSKDQFNYDITWGRMENGSTLSRIAMGYMWGAATGRVVSGIFKIGGSFARILGNSGGYTVAADKFDYFFGKSTSSPDNIRRSLQNKRDLAKFGITNSKQLIKKFDQAFKGTVIKTIKGEHGTTVVREVVVEDKGAIWVSFFYEKGNLKSLPRVVSIIPKLN